jgi:hypothetical protein
VPDQQPFAPGSTYQIDRQTGFRSYERYEMLVAESVTNSTTLVDSSQVVAPIGPGETFLWKATIFVAGNAPGDAKIAWATPATPAAGGALQVQGGGDPAGFGLATGYNAGIHIVTFAAATDYVLATYEGYLTNGATGGQFSLQLAQNGASLTATIYLPGTFLEVWRRAP